MKVVVVVIDKGGSCGLLEKTMLLKNQVGEEGYVLVTW